MQFIVQAAMLRQRRIAGRVTHCGHRAHVVSGLKLDVLIIPAWNEASAYRAVINGTYTKRVRLAPRLGDLPSSKLRADGRLVACGRRARFER